MFPFNWQSIRVRISQNLRQWIRPLRLLVFVRESHSGRFGLVSAATRSSAHPVWMPCPMLADVERSLRFDLFSSSVYFVPASLWTFPRFWFCWFSLEMELKFSKNAFWALHWGCWAIAYVLFSLWRLVCNKSIADFPVSNSWRNPSGLVWCWIFSLLTMSMVSPAPNLLPIRLNSVLIVLETFLPKFSDTKMRILQLMSHVLLFCLIDVCSELGWPLTVRQNLTDDAYYELRSIVSSQENWSLLVVW